MLDADETPESSARKKLKRSSRRDTADFTDFQDLLNTPESATPPTTATSRDVDIKGAKRGASGVEPAGKGSSGPHASEQSPTLGGGGGRRGGGGGTAVPREGSHDLDERRDSGETASVPDLLGLFERGSEDSSARYEADGSALCAEGRASSPRGGGGGGDGGRNWDGRESVGTASVGSVLGLLDCTPSPGGGLDQSVADGSALRGKSLARLYEDADATDSDSPAQGVRTRVLHVIR